MGSPCAKTAVAFPVSKMAGTPNSRATEARWLVMLPTSVMMPLIRPMRLACSGEAVLATRIALSGRSSESGEPGHKHPAGGYPGGSRLAAGQADGMAGKFEGAAGWRVCSGSAPGGGTAGKTAAPAHQWPTPHPGGSGNSLPGAALPGPGGGPGHQRATAEFFSASGTSSKSRPPPGRFTSRCSLRPI